LSNPNITFSVHLRPEYIAAVKACCERLQPELEELDRLLAHIEVESVERVPTPAVFPLAIVVDGELLHSVTLATEAERNAYCAGFNRGVRVSPSSHLMVVPETYGAHELRADVDAQVRASLGVP